MQSELISTLTISALRSFTAATAAIFVRDLLRQTHHHLTCRGGRALGDAFINLGDDFAEADWQ